MCRKAERQKHRNSKEKKRINNDTHYQLNKKKYIEETLTILRVVLFSSFLLSLSKVDFAALKKKILFFYLIINFLPEILMKNKNKEEK